MATPHQYTGEGGDAPAVSNGKVTEGSGQSYRESWRAKPFDAEDGKRVPGVSETIELTQVFDYTQADGKRRTTLSKSVTIDPPPNVEYGRIQQGTAATTGAVTGVELVGTTSTKGDGNQANKATTTDSTAGDGVTVSYAVASNVASTPAVGSSAGTGYAVGDILTVTGDTGVTMRVTSIS